MVLGGGSFERGRGMGGGKVRGGFTRGRGGGRLDLGRVEGKFERGKVVGGGFGGCRVLGGGRVPGGGGGIAEERVFL